MRSARRALMVAAGAAVLLSPFGSPRVSAADPVPPNTLLGWTGPNVPSWQVFDITGVPGDAPVDHFECSLDSGPWVTCTSPWAPTLTGGNHTVAARAVDANGLADPTPDERTVLVDTFGPVMSIAIDGGRAKTGRSYVGLALSGTDATSIQAVHVSNSADVDADGHLLHAWSGQLGNVDGGNWGWALDNATFGGSADPGLHTVCVQGVDLFGNWSAPACAGITLDPALPTTVAIRLAASENPAPRGDRLVVLATAEASDGAPIRDGTLTVAVTHQNGSSIPGLSESAPGQSLASGGTPFVDASSLPSGAYGMNAQFSGSAEIDTSQVSSSLTVGPSVGLFLPQAHFVVDAPIPSWDAAAPFTLGIASTYNAAVSYACRIDGAAWTPCADHLDVPLLAPGSHWAEVRGTDAAGRVQTVPSVVIWRVGEAVGGQWWIQPYASTAGKTVDLSFLAAGDLAVRVSNSGALDNEGRLADARVLDPIPVGSTAWDLTDPAYGGTDTDGNKPVWIQWQRADGTWTLPELATEILDRAAPHATVKIERGSPFVDRDQLLVLVKTDEPGKLYLSDDPAKLASPSGAFQVSSDGLAFLSWPVPDVAPGAVVTKTLYAVARDGAGNLSALAAASITIDRSVPTAAMQAPHFVLGSRVASSSVAVVVGARASDTGSGVASAVLQELASSTARTVASSSTTAVSVTRWLPFAGTRSYRSRALDKLGHVGAWASGPSLRPVLRNDTTSLIRWSGTWRSTASSAAIGGAYRRASAAGASATLRFVGRAVAIVAPRGAGFGKADVLVDGVRVAIIDLAAASSSRVVVFAKAWSAAGSHTVMLKVRGTAGRPTVPLDAFVVLP